jgi:hypothetical protein
MPWGEKQAFKYVVDGGMFLRHSGRGKTDWGRMEGSGR